MKISLAISNDYLTKAEQEIFKYSLEKDGLEQNIWKVFESLFKAPVKKSKPFVLRIFNNGTLIGAIILIKCRHYGKTLFSNRILSGLMNRVDIPFYLWIKFGCCMDMMSNQGFFANDIDRTSITKEAIAYLKSKTFLTIINDYADHSILYGSIPQLPALPHAVIDCSSYHSIDGYLENYKNIKRKLRVFKNKGGKFHLTTGKLNSDFIPDFKKCFQSTADKSIFRLPYQDLYFNSALQTNQTEITEVYYFIATINGEFIGYQAAIKSGSHLNALHGAFNRQRKSNYHAYDILFVKMVEFAISHDLRWIDVGAVINETKRKMINQQKEMSYFLLSKYKIVEWLFKIMLKYTNIQSRKHLQFR